MRKIYFALTILLSLPAVLLAQNSILIIGEDSTINCTEFNPAIHIRDTLQNSSNAFFIDFDFNNDSLTDATLKVLAYHPLMGAQAAYAQMYIYDTAFALVCDTEFYAWPDTLDIGDTIQNVMHNNVWATLGSWSQNYFDIRYTINGNGGFGGTGLWFNPTDHYLGLRTTFNNDTLFGYFKLRVNVLTAYSELWMEELCYPNAVAWSTGIENINDQPTSIRLYPNPFTNELAGQFRNSNSYECSLQDITGRTYLSVQQQGAFKLNLSELPSGLYLFIARDQVSGIRYVSKVNKQ